MNPEVSVLVPIRNAGETLGQALQSVLCQSFGNFEVIAVDDGSDDASPNILKAFAAKDPRVRPIIGERQGLIPALNIGLGACSGRLIARMDADDLCHPDRLRIQHKFLSEHPHISAVGTQIRCFPISKVGEGFRIYEQWINSLLLPEDIGREIFIESPLVHPTVCMRRSDLEAMGGYADNGWAEDYDLWLRLHLAGKKFAKIPRILLSWREGDGRLTRKDARYSVENFLRAKARYLKLGPLSDTNTIIIWGSGQIGRRISKHLQREGMSLTAFVDIDPRKIGNTRRGAPIISPDQLESIWKTAEQPMVLAAVPSRGARQLIRNHLAGMGMKETRDFICVA